MLEAQPLRFELDDERAVLTVRGDLESGETERFAEQVGARAEGGDLTVEMTDVTFLPSAAIGVLVTARQHAEDCGRQLLITAEQGTIADGVLRVMGIDPSR